MNDGGPAFSQCGWKTREENGGMSLRDWFAGMALQGMLSNGFQPNCARENFTNTADFNYVRAAYRIADQMLGVRMEPKP